MARAKVNLQFLQLFLILRHYSSRYSFREEKEDRLIFLLKGSPFPFIFISIQFPPHKHKSFNGANPALLSFLRVLSVPPQNAGNNIPDSADLSWR